MLLRRITEHVKTQSWFAVFLDFIIVIFGVFIGIQVANWNEDRADAAREQIYIAALKEDFHVVIEELEFSIETYDEIAASMKLLLEQSRKAEPDVSLETLNEATRALTTMVGTPLNSDTYTNLTGSGDLAIIKSQKLKNALSSFFGQVDVFILVSSTHELQLVNTFQPYMIANLDYAGMLPTDNKLSPKIQFNPEQIHTALPTTEFRNIVAVKWDAVVDLRSLLDQALEGARDVETLLEQETDKQ